ncbi:transposase [bacterium]|nr:transposase [bacterium]
MARQLRIEYEGAFYHVTSRGNEQKEIFVDEQDQKQFLKYIEQQVTRYSIKVHVWCLMNNHYHLVIETPLANLSRVMQTLNTSYTVYFNHRHKRVGHLFQGRYKAILVQADEYLEHLSRYIHLNPVRAGVVKKLEEYKWSSYRDYIYKNRNVQFLTTGFILGMFNSNTEKAKKLYKESIEKDSNTDANFIKDNISGGLILGKSDFVNWVKSKFIVDRKDEELTSLKRLEKRITINQIETEIRKRVEKEKLQRKLYIYLIRKYTDKKLEDIARLLGNMSYSAISQMCRRIEKHREEDKEMDLLLSRIEESLNVKI